MLAETMGSRALHEAALCRFALTDGAAMSCAFYQIVSQSPNTRLTITLDWHLQSTFSAHLLSAGIGSAVTLHCLRSDIALAIQ